jgi:hypothetical protein
MHILLESLPTTRPWKIGHVIKDGGPFQLLTGELGNIPITLRAHNEVDPEDSDNYLHLLHSLTIGVAGGRLTLSDTHGPLIWYPRLHVPDSHDIPGGLSMAAPAHLLEIGVQMLGPTVSMSYKEILMKLWPRAIARDLLEMREAIRKSIRADNRAQQELLCSCQWHDLTIALGYPVLRNHRGHQPLAVEILKAAVSEAVDALEAGASRETGPGKDDDVFACTLHAEREIQGIDARQVHECAKRFEEAALTSMLFALQSQGTLTRVGHEYSEAEILSASKTVPRHRGVILRWLRVLTERGHLRQKGKIFLVNEIVTLDLMRQQWDLVRESGRASWGLAASLTILWPMPNNFRN